MKKGLFRKGLVLGIILLFIGMSIIPSTVGIKKERTTITPVRSGGYIQDLIDNASEGDTIYIPSGIYYENVVIVKSISLVGEDKNTTIIDGRGNGEVIYVDNTDWVNISGFTILNNRENNGQYAGLLYNTTNYCTIKDCIIKNNSCGICFGWLCWYNSVQQNMIKDNYYGIVLGHGYNHYNKIYNNNLCTNDFGIWISASNYNEIFSNNILSNVNEGVYISRCICGGYKNKVFHNNFIYNGEETGQAYCAGCGPDGNFWDDDYPAGGNYWSDYIGVDDFSGPNQTIPGSDGIGDSPYVIPPDNNDYYPLMEVLDKEFPPIADFIWTPFFPDPGRQIHFNASESYDCDGIITLYEWDWDNDGVYDKSTTNPVSIYIFEEIGYYPVTLRVHCDSTETDEKTVVVRVGNFPPNASEIYGPNTGVPEVEYTFYINISEPDNDIFYVIWDWGDGTNSGWLGPYDSDITIIDSHNWSKKRTYEISVTVRDEYDGNVTIYKDITIPRSKSFHTKYFMLNWFLDSLTMLERLLSLLS